MGGSGANNSFVKMKEKIDANMIVKKFMME